MALAKAIAFWSTVSALGIGLWILLGFIFGKHAKTIRESIKAGLDLAAKEVREIGADWVNWGKERFRDLVGLAEKAFARISPERPAQDTLPNPQPPQWDDYEINVTLVVIGLFLLVVFGSGNSYLVYDVFPDLIELTPAQLRGGTTRYVAFLLTGMIILGEVGGGLLVKAERRRKEAGKKGASTAPGWIVFLFSYLFELAAGLRRAVSFLYSASPFADEATEITTDSIATALAWGGFAAILPWAIFALSVYVEPALSKSKVFERLFGAAGGFLKAVGVGILLIIAGCIASAFLGGSGGLVALGGYVLQLCAWCFNKPIWWFVGLLALLFFDAPGKIADWIRSFKKTPENQPPAVPPGSATAVLLSLAFVFASAVTNMACGEKPSGDSAGGVAVLTSSTSDGAPAVPTPKSGRKFDVLTEAELKPEPDPSVFDDVATVEIASYIGTNHKIVQVYSPSLRICVVDVTGSVRAPELRDVIVTKCAEFAAAGGTERTGIILPVTEAGITSAVPIVRIERQEIPSSCVVNPPIPAVPPASTTRDRKFAEIRAKYERVLRECRNQAIETYAALQRDDSAALRAEAGKKFAGYSPQKTDLFGALASAAEMVREERAKPRLRGIPVEIAVISDLEDDANACPGADGVPMPDDLCPSDELKRQVDALFADPKVRFTIRQVVQPPPGDPRSRGWAEAKAKREERQGAWLTYWLEAIGGGCVGCSEDRLQHFKFTAPAAARLIAATDDPETTDRDEGTSRVDPPKPPPKVKPQPKSTCPAANIATLRARESGVNTGRLRDAEWAPFGRALDACGPGTKPWLAVGTTEAGFKTRFVTPFVRAAGAKRKAPGIVANVKRDWGVR